MDGSYFLIDGLVGYEFYTKTRRYSVYNYAVVFVCFLVIAVVVNAVVSCCCQFKFATCVHVCVRAYTDA